MTFREKLARAVAQNHSLLCVGLDPDPAKMPVADLVAFGRGVIEATADLVCCYKPNFAFYEQFGPEGMRALAETIRAVPAPVPVLGDAKRGDIGNTARAYARAIFEVYGCDGVTVSPFMGRDSVQPFLDHTGRTTFLLCRTSNPGARDLQDRLVEGTPLYLVVAQLAREWNTAGNVGLVVGATYPQELAQVRRVCPDQLILLPGLGAQAGDLAAALAAGLDARGGGLICSASRQIIYAGKGPDFAGAVRAAARELRDAINALRPARQEAAL